MRKYVHYLIKKPCKYYITSELFYLCTPNEIRTHVLTVRE